MIEASRAAHLNPRQLEENLDGAMALNEILPIFLASAEDCIERLDEASSRHNLIGWRQVAHELKGAALSVTARRLAELCIEAEAVARMPDEQAGAVLYHMQKELAILRQEVAKLL